MPSNPSRVLMDAFDYEDPSRTFVNREKSMDNEYFSCFNHSIELMHEPKSSFLDDLKMTDKKDDEPILPKKLVMPKSFKEALSGSNVNDNLGVSIASSSINGMPAIIVSEKDLNILDEPYKFALVGKFSFRRPYMDEIRKFFHDLHLTGMFSITLLDARHVFINLSNELDYSRVFLRRSYFVKNCQMRLLKWSMDFDIHAESSICPVWLSLPNLRMHFFDIKILQAIGSLFGRSLQVDQATSNKNRPSVARLLVEIDITKEYPNEIWLGSDSHGYSQKVVFDKFPIFCSHCKLHGHDLHNCFILNPHLKEKNGKVQTPIISTNSPNSISKEQIQENILNNYLKNVENEWKELKDPINVSNSNINLENSSSSIKENKENNLELIVYDENVALKNSLCADFSLVPERNLQIVSSTGSPICFHNASPNREEKCDVSIQNSENVLLGDTNACFFNKSSDSLNEDKSMEIVKDSIELEEGEMDSGTVSETKLLVGKNKIFQIVYNTRGKKNSAKNSKNSKSMAKSHSYHK